MPGGHWAAGGASVVVVVLCVPFSPRVFHSVSAVDKRGTLSSAYSYRILFYPLLSKAAFCPFSFWFFVWTGFFFFVFDEVLSI